MAVTVAQLVEQKHLTQKQGANLPKAFALKVGLKNKKNKRFPKESLSSEAWAAKKAAKKTGASKDTSTTKKNPKNQKNKKKKKVAPKGYHYMPSGKLMKDSDMKKKKGKY
jgi:hypothetical protein